MLKKRLIYSTLFTITFFILASVFVIEPLANKHSDAAEIAIALFLCFLVVKYVKAISFVLIAPWNNVVKEIRKNKYSDNKHSPLVSVIIPAYNEEVGLLETVKTVLTSKYQKIEIIVVNDGSTDKSHDIMTAFVKKIRLNKKIKRPTIKYYYKKNGGKGGALNFGIAKARGGIIMTIDADCIITPDTITNFVEPFSDPSTDAVVGNVKIGNTSTVVGTVQFLEFLNSFYAKNAESVLGTIYIIGGAAAAFRKTVFDTIGFYSDINITEDIDISVRICAAGMKVVYADDAIVYTEGASTVNGLAKQRLRWKMGWFQTIYDHKHFIFSRDKKHNKLLSWVLIPFVYFSSVQLVFEPWFVLFLYIYSYFIRDFSPFITWIGAETIMILFVLIKDRKYQNLSTIFLGPITWLLFYLATYIEFRSLFFTIWHIIKKKELKWQKWERSGCGVNINSLQ
jgi:cellulose synthase/poly-beta-1,6-N-acetylglucosamine synthase-like glycosyltransferase